MGPLVRELVASGIRQVKVFPSPVLSLLPLQAAHDVAGRAVIDDIIVAYAPFATTRAATSGERPQTPALLGVADDRKDGPLPELPYAVVEAEIISTHFEAHRRLNVSATTVADVKAALCDADIAHFACHGYTDHTNAMMSGLAVAADGDLTLDDLLTLPRRSRRLAILAGCETALVSLSALHRGVSLASAFLVCCQRSPEAA